MNEFDLPPERRLPDGVKQQMKRDLINETVPTTRLRGRTGWIAAGVASVAVAAMAIGGAVLLGGDNEAGPDPAPPAGSGTANDPIPSSTPTDPKSAAEEKRRESVAPPTDLSPAQPVDCKPEVAEFSKHQGLPAATKRATATYDGGTMTLWGADEWWVVCDDWAATVDGGKPTVIGNHPWPAATLTKELFQISMNFSDREAQYFSGGPVPDGVEKIEYRFSDGKSVTAVIGDGMWTMVRMATDGPYGPSTVDPIGATVVVTKSGGQTEEFQLKDPGDFCAQLNHGC